MIGRRSSAAGGVIARVLPLIAAAAIALTVPSGASAAPTTGASQERADGDGAEAAGSVLLDRRRVVGLVLAMSVATPPAPAPVAAFQRHRALREGAPLEDPDWARLAGPLAYPAFGALCDYSVGNAKANWMTPDAIARLTQAARVLRATGLGRVAVGDASLEHGGPIPGHETHQVGLDVDLRLMRSDGRQCTRGTTWRSAAYSRSATRALIEAIDAAAPGHVKLVYFDDPVLIREGLVVPYPGHDNHLHVRYCEDWYPIAAYRCGPDTVPTGGGGG